jgi:hypothetical protein
MINTLEQIMNMTKEQLRALDDSQKAQVKAILVMNMTKEQLRALDDSQKAQVKAILKAEIEKILQRNKK